MTTMSLRPFFKSLEFEFHINYPNGTYIAFCKYVYDIYGGIIVIPEKHLYNPIVEPRLYDIYFTNESDAIMFKLKFSR